VTAYATPCGREQIVPLNLGRKPATASRPTLDNLGTGIGAFGDGDCLEFVASHRTGNIEITLDAQTPHQGAVETSSGDSSAGLEGGPEILGSRPRPHAAMPEATGDFCDDLQTFGTEVPATPQDAMMEDLMAKKRTEQDATQRLSRPVGHGGVDVRLARIIEAWPRLPARTRAAMTALLADGDQAVDPAGKDAERPPALRPVRAKETQTKDAGGGRRRGPRKSANLQS
jgi:hypothetical protein